MPTKLSEDQVTWELLEFLSASLGSRLGPDDDFFALGLANSLFALELITFVEQRYALTIGVQDLELDNFSTVGQIAGFVTRKSA
jgi:methoxymalonate biosynthesis acyl carrier protein